MAQNVRFSLVVTDYGNEKTTPINMATALQHIALDRINNYLTDSLFAEHNSLSEEHAKRLLKLCLEIHEAKVANPEYGLYQRSHK